jgi:hypothetical protein
LQGLRLAESDNRLGHLDEERLDRIVATVRELVSDLEAHYYVEATNVTASDLDSQPGALGAIEQTNDKPTLAEQWGSPRSVLCIPGATKLDEAATLVLAQLMRRRGFGAVAERADTLSMSNLSSLDLTGTSLVFVCYIDRPSSAKIQYVVRRLSKKSNSVGVVLALLGAENAALVESPSSTPVAEGSFAVVLSALFRAASEKSGSAAIDSKHIVAP